MVDYASRKRGNVVLPLATATGNTALRDADPAIYFALEYFTYVLNYTIGASLIEHGATVSKTFTSAVHHSLPLDPKPLIEQEYFDFPVLAVYRQRGKISDHTLSLRHNECRIVVEYILPPLTGGQAEVLVPLLNAAQSALELWCKQGFSPAHTPNGGAAGDSPWDEDYGGVEGIDLDEPVWGYGYGGSSPLPFYWLTMQGVLTEIDSQLPAAFDDFAGANVDIDIEDPTDGSRVANVVEMETQQPPTFTSVVPATAPVAGGTALVITGTLFKAPVRVWIAGEEVTAVVTSSTRIDIAASPEVEAYLAGATFDLEIECVGTEPRPVRDDDDRGFSVIATDAFTFTA